MTINSWKKVISDKPAIYTDNKNEIYIDWFLVSYPSPERSTIWGKASLTILLFASVSFTKILQNLCSKEGFWKSWNSVFYDHVDLSFSLQFSFVKDRIWSHTYSWAGQVLFHGQVRSSSPVWKVIHGRHSPSKENKTLSSDSSNESTAQKLSDLTKVIHVPIP